MFNFGEIANIKAQTADDKVKQLKFSSADGKPKNFVARNVIDLTKPEVVRYYTYPIIAAANSPADDFSTLPFGLRFVDRNVLNKHLQSKYARAAINLIDNLQDLIALLSNLNIKTIEQHKNKIEGLFMTKFDELLGTRDVYLHQLYNRRKYNLLLAIRVNHLLDILEPLPGLGYYGVTEEYYRLLIASIALIVSRRRTALKLITDIQALQKLAELTNNRYVQMLAKFYQEILLPLVLNSSAEQYLFNAESIAGQMFHTITSEITLSNNFLLNLVLVKKFADYITDLNYYKPILATPLPKLVETLRTEYSKVADAVDKLREEDEEFTLHNIIRQIIYIRNNYRTLIQKEIDFANACYTLGYRLNSSSDIKPDTQLGQLKADIEAELIEIYANSFDIPYDFYSQSKQVASIVETLTKILNVKPRQQRKKVKRRNRRKTK